MLRLGSKAKKSAIVSKRGIAAEVLAEKRAETAYAKYAAKVRQILI